MSLPYGEDRVALTGTAERNLKLIRDRLGVNVWARDGTLKVSGPNRAVGLASAVLERLADAAKRREPMDCKQLIDSMVATPARPGGNGARMARGGSYSSSSPSTTLSRPNDGDLEVYLTNHRINALTPSQQQYIDAIRSHDLTLCTGPAGTGKTYLAVAASVDMMRKGQIRKIVLVRPAVEAGEKLGFLPGSMQDKVNPYLRPLLDALHDMMDYEQIQRFMACDLIEIVPLAFMRGRTLNDAVIILDEAQNATRSQMLMFLTRLGRSGKMIVTGDTSQIDLEDPRQSGLIDAVRRVRRIPGVATVTLDQADIVRHHLVQRIVEAYGQDNHNHEKALCAQESSQEPPDIFRPGVGRQDLLGLPATEESCPR